MKKNIYNYLENSFFSKVTVLSDKIITKNEIDKNMNVSDIAIGKIYEYSKKNDTRNFIFKTQSGNLFSLIFTINGKKPVDALKTTFGQVKEDFVNGTFNDLFSAGIGDVRETEKQISTDPQSIKKVFSTIYTILIKLYYPKYKKVAFRATLLPSEIPFKNLYLSFSDDKKFINKKDILDKIKEHEEELNEMFEKENDSEVLKRFNKLKTSFIKKINSLNDRIDFNTFTKLFNDFEAQAFFRHRLYRAAINMSLKEIEKEINQTINVDFDYQKTDRYIVLSV